MDESFDILQKLKRLDLIFAITEPVLTDWM